MTTVFNVLEQPGLTRLEGQLVIVELVASTTDEFAPGYVPAEDLAVFSRAIVKTDETGRWELDLRPTAAADNVFSVAGLVYKVSESAAGGESSYYIDVPGPVLDDDDLEVPQHVFPMLTIAPTALPTLGDFTAADVALDTTGFDNNLNVTIENVQLFADFVDDMDLTTGTPGGSGGHVIVQDALTFTQRDTLRFISPFLAVSDDNVEEETVVTFTSVDLEAIDALTTAPFGRGVLEQANAADAADYLEVVPTADIGVTVASLVGGLVPTSQLPALAINDVFTVNSGAAMLALPATVGDVAIRTDTEETYILAATPATDIDNWVLFSFGGGVTSVNGQAGIVVLDATDVGAVDTATFAAHLNDLVDAHDGAAISIDASGFTGTLDNTVTDVQTFAEAVDAFLIGSGSPTGAAGGELGGTYPNPTVNALHSGSTHANVQANAEATAAGALAAHVADIASAHVATAINVDDSTFTGFLSGVTTVQNGFAAVDAITAADVPVDPALFSSNLDGTVLTVQLLAEAVDQLTIAPLIESVNGQTGVVVLDAAAVGAIDVDQFGVPSGVATLDITGVLDISQWPDLVSEVNGLTGEVLLTGADIPIAADGFSGNLDNTVTDVQLLADAVDVLASSAALPLSELSQDESRRAGYIYSGRIKTQLVVDLFIGDSIARGVGGTLGVSDWSTVYAELESNAAGVANNGPGIKLCNEDESIYGSFKWDSLAQGSAATSGGISSGTSSWRLTSSGHTIGDTDRFRRAEVFFRKAASGSPNIEISTNGGSSWSSPISTTGTGIGSWLSADLGTVDTRTLQVRSAGTGTAIIEGYRGYLTDGTVGYLADNLGHGGTDTGDWTTERGWETYATLVDPRRIVIAVGENHALNGDSLGTMTAGLTTIVQRAKAAAPLAEIVVVGEQYAWTTGLTDVGFSTWTNTWIPAIEAICVAEGVTFVDHNKIFGDCSEHDDRWTITMDGGLHFGGTGQRARAQATFARLSHGYTYPAIQPSAIESGALAGGGKFRISDGGSNSVGLAVYADEGDTAPMAALGGFFSAPLIAFGPGGTTAADCLLGRNNTSGVFTISPGFNVTDLAGGGEVRLRDFGSNSPSLGFYTTETDTQAAIGIGLITGGALLTMGGGGSSSPDILLTRAAAGSLRQTDGTDAHGSIRSSVGTFAGSQATSVAVRNNATDTVPAIQLLSFAGAPSIELGPGGSGATDVVLSRSATKKAALNSALDLTATDNALTLNRLTTTQRDALTPVDGMTIYNTTTQRVEHRTLGAWTDMFSASSVWQSRYRQWEDFEFVAANTTNDTQYGTKLYVRLAVGGGAGAGAGAQQHGTEVVGGHTVYGAGVITTGTGTSARSAVSPETSYTFTNTDVLRFFARIRLGNVSDVNQTFIVRAGFLDANTGVAPTNGGLYVEANTNANWMCINNDDTTTTGTNQSSGIAVANSAYVNIGIHWDGTQATPICNFWMSTGTSAMTNVISQTANPPDNGTVLIPCISIVKSNGGTARTVIIDGMGFDIPLNRGVNFRI